MGKKIKILNLDQGGEYQGAEFVEYLKLNVHDTVRVISHNESGGQER